MVDDFNVIMIKGIRFEDYVYTGEDIHIEPREMAINILRKRGEKLYASGVRRVEFDTLAGFHFRHRRNGRFVLLTTMHALRFLKK